MPENFNNDSRDGEPPGSEPNSKARGAGLQFACGDRDRLPHLRIRVLYEFTVVEIVDANLITEDEAVNDLGSHLQNLVDSGNTRLLLNLNGMHYASSTVLSKLAYLNRKVVANQGVLRIYGLDPELFDALRICRLDHIFEVYADEIEAISVDVPSTKFDRD